MNIVQPTDGVVEIDQLQQLNGMIDSLQAEIERRNVREAGLIATVEHLRARKEHYKGTVQRAKIVLQAAWLLDESLVRTEVLADALLGDDPLPPQTGPRTRCF